MIVDARYQTLPKTVNADVIILGAGAAGITIALELAKSGIKIIMIEAGGESFDKASQDFYRADRVEPAAHGPTQMYRRRVLGGSTSVWGGRCIPFDPIDFEYRPWMQHSGWPIGYDDIACYYPKALKYAAAGTDQFRSQDALPGQLPFLVEGVDSPDVVLDRVERFSSPLHFGRYYRRSLSRTSNITVFLHAAATQIITDDSGNAVRGVDAKVGEKRNVLTVLASKVIVAMGGLETPRLLLASNRLVSCGLGNRRDNVGRFYQCHIEGSMGNIVFKSDQSRVRQDYQKSVDGVYVRRYIWLSPQAQRTKQLAGLVIRPHHASIVDPQHGNGVLSAMYLAKSMIVPEYARKMTAVEDSAIKGRGGSPVSFYFEHMRNILLGSPQLSTFSAKWIRHRILAKRKLPSVVLSNPCHRYPADFNAEQEPNRQSRVLLSEQTDPLGMPRIQVDWRSTEADYRRLARGIRVIQEAFQPSKTIELDLSSIDILSQSRKGVPVGGHHIGTARMSSNPSMGVCDTNCEVFDCKGLYLAGASTFPTSSFANPTLTLIALALRLSAHISAQFEN